MPHSLTGVSAKDQQRHFAWLRKRRNSITSSARLRGDPPAWLGRLPCPKFITSYLVVHKG